MQERRITTYHLESVGNFSAVERAIAKIGGVLSVSVDENAKLLKYEIDEWASDYDVFTEVMRICAECGAVIDFDYQQESEAQEDSSEKVAVEPEIVESENLPIEVEEVEEKNQTPTAKKKSALSERWQRVIELGVAVVCYIVALFLTDIVQYIFLAISFATAGYDALYEAIVKISKKQIFSEELLITIAFFVSILVGYAEFAVGALLLYSLVAFARKTIREEIEKNPAFAKNIQSVMRYKDDGIENVEADKIVCGDQIFIEQNTVTPFDGIVEDNCTVENFKGVCREIKAGDPVFAGEKIVTEIKLTVTAVQDDCKFAKYNKYVNKASANVCPIAEKMQKYSQVICIGVFAFCLLIAFICPLFETSYKTYLVKWAYRAAIIASVSGLGFYTFASEINLLSLLARGRKCKLGFSGYDAVANLANAKGIFIDHEGVILDSNGDIKEDSFGAIRELKDAKMKDISLACTLSDEKAEEVCKQLKIKEYYSRERTDAKLQELKKALESGKAVATSAKNYCDIKGSGAVVSFNCEEQGYSGDVCISSDEIAYLPYAVKLAKRTAKIQKFNLILGLGVKAIIITLALLGFAELWWAVLADSLVSVICAVNAYLSSKEVY